jgi:hypothetical protein
VAAWRTADGLVLVEGASRPRPSAAWGLLGGEGSFFLLDGELQEIRQRFEPHEGSLEDDLWSYSYRVARGELLERFVMRRVVCDEPESVEVDKESIKLAGLEPVELGLAAVEARLRALLEQG